MNQDNLKKWEPMARALSGAVPALRAPSHILLGEALDVVRFCQRNWKPVLQSDGKVIRPGLKEAVGNGTFTDGIAGEILELHDAFQAAQTRYQLLVAGSALVLVERARFLIGELRATLDWYFDDGVEDERDAQLAGLIKAHESALSHDALAAALFDYAELAERNVDAIKGLGGFSPGLVQEARDLAMQLRERSAGPVSPEPVPPERDALELRNRIGALLYDRMQRVRAAARFVFRHHPTVVRDATSAYFRKQRSAHRQQEAAAPAEETEPVVAPV